MINFDFIDINEAIDGMTYEKQMDYLKKKEADINKTIEKSKALLSYIKELKDEIESERRQELTM